MSPNFRETVSSCHTSRPLAAVAENVWVVICQKQKDKER